MSKETYSRIIDRYFSTQKNKNVIEDLTDEQLSDLTELYGFEVSNGECIYRYFLKDGESYKVQYFSTSHITDVLKVVLISDNTFIEDRVGIPVFG